ncbi:hypothetical protein [Neobacillus niacini]|uniref:hypothetical protein n=1 Tax=Neobacillus niacini TaxID=86668 RepID=UPI002863EE87|nr:hypothetical protein [Neobacillus niacini]MDR7001143.1 hypothetical protein [Neobacillus niacini]
MKRFLSYLVWLLFIMIILYLGAEIESRLRAYQEQYYRPFPYIVFSGLFPIFVGLLIRTPQLVGDLIKKKRLSVDWALLTAIGIPSFIIATIPLSFIVHIPYLYFIWFKTFGSSLTVNTIAGVIFGYVFLYSFKEK